MKKFLRFLGILLLIVIVAIVVLGLVEPKDVIVERSTTINAPQAVVMDQVTNFKNWNNWSPWYKMEPTMKMEYTGTDGQPGSGYHWTGTKTGEGTMTNTGVDNGTMKFDLKFMKPHEANADGWFKTKDASGQTKVTWGLHMHCSFPMNFMNAFMNMDKMMGPDFESGLKDMKTYAEAHATAANDIKITETQFPGHIYCGVHKTIGWNDLSKFFMDTKNQLGQPPTWGLYWTWDTVKHQTDMAAVFVVADSSKRMKGASYINVPSSSACMVAYTGPYQGMMSPHMALHKYCASKNMKVKLVMEEYLKGPGNEKDSTKYVTNIYYLCDGMQAMASK